MWRVFYCEKIRRYRINTNIHGRGNTRPQQKKDNTILNEDIQAKEVRLIGSEGEPIGIVTKREALEKAAAAELDLVLIAPTATPPVAKIMDYRKYLFEQGKKQKEAKKKQKVITIKETKLRYNIGEADKQVSIKRSRGFLEEGDKVKFTLMFKGREIAHPDLAYKLMVEIEKELSDVGVIESKPTMEGRRMIMVMGPISKKGGHGHAKNENT